MASKSIKPPTPRTNPPPLPAAYSLEESASDFVVDPTRQAVSSPVREDPRSESTASCAGANRGRARSCLAEVRELDGPRSRGGPQHHRRRFVHAPVQLPATQTLVVGDGASPIQTAASPVPAQRSRDETPFGAIGGGYLHIGEGIDPRRQLLAACAGREVHVHQAPRAEQFLGRCAVFERHATLHGHPIEFDRCERSSAADVQSADHSSHAPNLVHFGASVGPLSAIESKRACGVLSAARVPAEELHYAGQAAESEAVEAEVEV